MAKRHNKSLLFRFLVTVWNHPKSHTILFWPIIPISFIPVKIFGRNTICLIVCAVICFVLCIAADIALENILKKNGVNDYESAMRMRKKYKLSAITVVLFTLLMAVITCVLMFVLFIN